MSKEFVFKILNWRNKGVKRKLPSIVAVTAIIYFLGIVCEVKKEIPVAT
jgi:hypothetical protein